MQNLDTWETYSAAIERGDAAARPRLSSHATRSGLIREFVLQLKKGSIRPAYFREKYGVDVLERFREPLASLAPTGYLARGRTTTSWR